MEGTPPERDLRETAGAARPQPPFAGEQRTYSPPAPPPQQRPPQPAQPQAQPPAYTETIQESGLTGIRIVSKLIDVIAIVAIMQIVMLPFSVFPSLMERFGADQEEFLRQMETVESFSEIYRVYIDTMGGFLVFTVIMQAIGTFAYFFISEYMTRQTLGKKAFGLRVVAGPSGRMTARQAAVRAAITTVSIAFWLWIVDILVMIVRRDGKSVADILAGTRVVRAVKHFIYPWA